MDKIFSARQHMLYVIARPSVRPSHVSKSKMRKSQVYIERLLQSL